MRRALFSLLSIQNQKYYHKKAMAGIDLLKERLRNKDKNLPKLYEAEASTNEELRQYFDKYQGGSVQLTFERENIAIVTLDQPAKRNAISGKMMGDLLDVVERLETWHECKGVIIRGSNGNFCSGGDLEMARGTGNADGGFKMATYVGNILDRFQALPLVTVALLEGCGALGGGSEISLACDYRLITSSCHGIGCVHGRMGILPAWGGTRRLLGIVGYRRALEVLTTAKVYKPDNALSIGLVDEVIPDENPFDFTLDWLQSRARVSSNVIHGAKISLLLARQHVEGEEFEKRIFAMYWGCEENKQALAANIKHKS